MRVFPIAVVLGLLPRVATAQLPADPPFNPHHIEQLPVDIRSGVQAKCPSKPSAGHYFATYYHDEAHLHFEHLHCPGVSFCDASGCLQQTYKLSGGHYHLLKTFHAPAND